MRLVCRRSFWCSSRCRDLCARVVSWYRIESGFMEEGDDANGAAYGMLALLPRVPIGRSEGVASAPALGGASRLRCSCAISRRQWVRVDCMQQRLCCSRMRGRRLPRRGEGRWLPWKLFVCPDMRLLEVDVMNKLVRVQHCSAAASGRRARPRKRPARRQAPALDRTIAAR